MACLLARFSIAHIRRGASVARGIVGGKFVCVGRRVSRSIYVLRVRCVWWSSSIVWWLAFGLMATCVFQCLSIDTCFCDSVFAQVYGARPEAEALVGSRRWCVV